MANLICDSANLFGSSIRSSDLAFIGSNRFAFAFWHSGRDLSKAKIQQGFWKMSARRPNGSSNLMVDIYWRLGEYIDQNSKLVRLLRFVHFEWILVLIQLIRRTVLIQLLRVVYKPSRLLNQLQFNWITSMPFASTVFDCRSNQSI